MPVHFKYNNDNNVLYGSIEGQLSMDEVRLMMEQLVVSKDFASDVRALWDLRKLNFTNIDANFERQLILLRQSFPEREKAKIALVSNVDLSFGMKKMYEMLADDMHQNMKVFSNFTDAENWILDE